MRLGAKELGREFVGKQQLAPTDDGGKVMDKFPPFGVFREADENVERTQTKSNVRPKAWLPADPTMYCPRCSRACAAAIATGGTSIPAYS
jgi:hypothetical protein